MGMGFEVVNSFDPFMLIWVPVTSTTQLCVGQLVTYGKVTNAYTGGVSNMTAASGVCDTTNLQIPDGIVVGTSDAADYETYTQLGSTGVYPKSITGVDTTAAQQARQNRGVEGMYAKGDNQAFVLVSRINHDTMIKGYFRNSATVGTTNILTKATDTVTYTSSAITFAATMGFTPATGTVNATTFCVTGNNAGIYRPRTDNSATASTYTRQWPNTPAATDTFKSVNVRQGHCRMQLDTTYGMWIDNTAALTSHYFDVLVHSIDLNQDAGNEYCIFSFMPVHWVAAAAARAIT